MEKFVYFSHDSRFKTPFGAVREGEPVTISVYVSPEIAPLSVSLILTDEKTNEYSFSMSLMEDKNYLIYSVVFAPQNAGLFFYCFEIKTLKGTFTAGHTDRIPKLDDYKEKWQLTVTKKEFETPSVFYGKTMYQIFPDRFCKGALKKAPEFKKERKIHKSWDEIPESITDTPDYAATDFFGGNINGIIQMLPYLKDLNIDIIYLNPVFESASNHRYNTGDYLKIDPLLGNEDDFKLLCIECEKQNIKIILDGVFSHTGSDSIYFNKDGHYKSIGAYQSKESPYFPWYRFEKHPDQYDCWWGFPTLPNVNETEKSYLDFITDTKDGVLAKWQKIGVSGWRLDVADELPDLFLDKLRENVKKTNNNALIIGEVWEDASNKKSYGIRRRYLLGEQLDSVMNYPFREAIIEYIIGQNAELFWNRILPILENYPLSAINCLMNSLSTHDTVRAITELSGLENIPPEKQGGYVLPKENYFLAIERFKLASFLQFTLPGIPCIYYGDEVGLYGFRDPFNRMPYPFGKEDFNLLEFFKELTAFRRQFHKDFTEVFRLYQVKNNVFSFFRGSILICINSGDTTEELEIDFVPSFLYGLRVTVSNKKIILIPFSFGAFMSED